MKFQTKLVLGFSIVVFFISVILGAVYYEYNCRRLNDMMEKNMEFYAEEVSNKIDTTFDTMKQITDYILSNPDMLESMLSLPIFYAKKDNNGIKECQEILTSGITLDYVRRNFYRVVIFNGYTDAISSSSGEYLINKQRDISKIEWLDRAYEAHGKPILNAPCIDGWGARKIKKVFSLCRKVQGGDFGYIEVQNDAEKLETIFALPDSDLEVIAWLPNEEVLFASNGMQSTDIKNYYKLLSDKEDKIVHEKEKNKTIYTSLSNNYGIKIAVIMNKENTGDEFMRLLLLAVILSIVCFGISMILVVYIANKLSRPLSELKNKMEHTYIENLDEEWVFETSNDEMVALGNAYQNLTKRLNDSIIKEKKLSLLQLQAQFDTLQAQVNPHFIYNVLNTISNRGVINEDEEICEICGSLAAMLRYAANNKVRFSTIEQELSYVQKYVYLLKSRYEHRLEVNISCNKEIYEEILPKIVIQQLVENCIQHGYTNSFSVMKILIEGWYDKEHWYIRVRDNGEGITEEVRQNIEKKMEAIRKKIMTPNSNIEMEIGGMGLANTYARMYLMYAENTIFKMENTATGCSILIGARRKDDTENV